MSLSASFLVVYNNVAYCLALVLLLSLLTGGRTLKFISAFILIVIAGLLLTPHPNLIMPVTVCVLTFCFSGLWRKKVIPAFRSMPDGGFHRMVRHHAHIMCLHGCHT